MKTLLAAIVFAALAPSAFAASSPWTGVWALDPARAEPKGAAPSYTLAVSPQGDLDWQIPAIGEIVNGHTDGKPMVISRLRPTPGLTLSVLATGPRTWRYTVEKYGAYQGGGLMTLAPDGKSWTDIPYDHDTPHPELTMVYLKQ